MGHWDIRCAENKHTQTGICIIIHFANPSVKNLVCKTLINRAKTICEVDNIDGELKHFRSVLKMNGYPKKFIGNAMKTRQHVRKRPNISLLSTYRILVFCQPTVYWFSFT